MRRNTQSISVSLYYLNKGSNFQIPTDIQSQLERINNVQKSISDLNVFLSDQKIRLEETEATIQKLKREREKLKPLVESDRKTIEALASMIDEKIIQKNIWKERAIGFILAIIGSLLVSAILRLAKTKRDAQKPFKIDIPEKIPGEPTILFYDKFEKLDGWQDYKKGTISLSDEFAYQGNYSLKKDGFNDPNGGYKIFPRPISSGFCFSGWIYRPSGKSGGKGDRLAVEDENFNGYGFFISHTNTNNWIRIELRENGSASTMIAEKNAFDCPKDEWYQFLLSIKINGVLELSILNSNGDQLTSLSGENSQFNIFDRIVIHGGKPYYNDDIKVEKTDA